MTIDDGYLDGYFIGMTEYSIATAKDQLPRLIDRMLDGESVTITRRGKPVARVVAVEGQRDAHPVAIDIEWLRSVRTAAATGVQPTIDTVKAMRDDYRY